MLQLCTNIHTFVMHVAYADTVAFHATLFAPCLERGKEVASLQRDRGASGTRGSPGSGPNGWLWVWGLGFGWVGCDGLRRFIEIEYYVRDSKTVKDQLSKKGIGLDGVPQFLEGERVDPRNPRGWILSCVFCLACFRHTLGSDLHPWSRELRGSGAEGSVRWSAGWRILKQSAANNVGTLKKWLRWPALSWFLFVFFFF